MTSNKEDYLKAIFEIGGAERFVSNKELAEKLGVAAGSVSEMLGKLRVGGLIEARAYRGFKLSEEGLAACMKIVRSHRLWEVFLERYLGYDWREAHEDAHLLEHAAPERLVERLEAFMDYPETCPHGSEIPQRGGKPRPRGGEVALSSLVPGERARLTRIGEEPELLDYLSASGLRLGGDIELLSAGEYEGPLCIRQQERSLTLSYKAATQIFVERLA